MGRSSCVRSVCARATQRFLALACAHACVTQGSFLPSNKLIDSVARGTRRLNHSRHDSVGRALSGSVFLCRLRQAARPTAALAHGCHTVCDWRCCRPWRSRPRVAPSVARPRCATVHARTPRRAARAIDVSRALHCQIALAVHVNA